MKGFRRGCTGGGFVAVFSDAGNSELSSVGGAWFVGTLPSSNLFV